MCVRESMAQPKEKKYTAVPQRIQLIYDTKKTVCAVHMRMVPDSSQILLATGSIDNTLRLYASRVDPHMMPQFQLRSHANHNGSVYAVEFNMTATVLLSSSSTDQLFVWDVRDIAHPKRIKTLPHPNTIMSAHWCGSDGTIITACADNKIRIFDRKFKCRTVSVPSADTLFAMACSQKTNTIVVGDSKGCVFRFKLPYPSNVISRIKAHPDHDVSRIDISDDAVCLSAGSDGYVCIWNMKSDKIEKILHPKEVRCVYVVPFSRDVFFTTCNDCHVRMYDRSFHPTRMLFKIKTPGISFCITCCALPGQQGGLFAFGCIGGRCEVYRCLSIRGVLKVNDVCDVCICM